MDSRRLNFSVSAPIVSAEIGRYRAIFSTGSRRPTSRGAQSVGCCYPWAPRPSRSKSTRTQESTAVVGTSREASRVFPSQVFPVSGDPLRAADGRQVILSTGPAVDVLVTSGVASYLEFKDMQALYLASDATRRGPGGESGRRSSRGLPSGLARPHVGTTGRVGEPSAAGESALGTAHAASLPANGGGTGARQRDSTSHGIALSRVPCSKADVFATKLLRPLEKRLLMRFLLFVSDWGLQRAGEDVLGRNEAGLGRGRSLRRPQNREVASSDFDAVAYSGKPFQAFLESCGLPERVRAMVTHALALLPGTGGGDCGGGAGRGESPANPEPTTEEGLEAVYRYAAVLQAWVAPSDLRVGQTTKWATNHGSSCGLSYTCSFPLRLSSGTFPRI